MGEKSDIPEKRDTVTVVKFFSAEEQMKINEFEREMLIRDRMAEIAAAKRDGRAEAEEELKKVKEEAARAQERLMKAQERLMQQENATCPELETNKSAVRSVKALMTKLKLTAEEAMDILETPADKREIYRKMIEEE